MEIDHLSRSLASSPATETLDLRSIFKYLKLAFALYRSLAAMRQHGTLLRSRKVPRLENRKVLRCLLAKPTTHR